MVYQRTLKFLPQQRYTTAINYQPLHSQVLLLFSLLFLSFYLKIKRTTQLFIYPNNTVIPLLVASTAKSSLKATLV